MDSNPYYLIFPSDSQASQDEFVPPSQSTAQDFYVAPSLHATTSEYRSTAAQPHSLLSQDSCGTSQASRMSRSSSARSFRPSVGSGSIRNLSLSSHPYQQARLCHLADRTSAHQQEPFSNFPAPIPTSGALIPYDAVIGSCASAPCPDSGQPPFITRKISPDPTCASASQSNFVSSNTNENTPSSMGSISVPEQAFLPAYTPPSPPPHTPADQADIEYAQYRYGDKRCFYQCRFDLRGSPCNQWIVGDRTRVLRHLRQHHHLQIGPAAPALCRWEECTHSRPMKQENLSRHVVMHLGVKWRCPHCRRLFSRDDAVHRHIERMAPGMDITDAEVVPGREARAITAPQFKRARTA